jgi:hypothetical protein
LTEHSVLHADLNAIARIKLSKINVPVGQNDHPALFEPNSYMHPRLPGPAGPLPQLAVVRCFPPYVGKIRINVNGESWRVDKQNHLAVVRVPFRSQSGTEQPIAIEIAAFLRPRTVDFASAVSRGTMPAPPAPLFLKRSNPHHFAAQRAFTALPTGSNRIFEVDLRAEGREKISSPSNALIIIDRIPPKALGAPLNQSYPWTPSPAS